MLIGRSITILYFLARKTTAEHLTVYFPSASLRAPCGQILCLVAVCSMSHVVPAKSYQHWSPEYHREVSQTRVDESTSFEMIDRITQGSLYPVLKSGGDDITHFFNTVVDLSPVSVHRG